MKQLFTIKNHFFVSQIFGLPKKMDSHTTKVQMQMATPQVIAGYLNAHIRR
jgi:hypothetical protein